MTEPVTVRVQRVMPAVPDVVFGEWLDVESLMDWMCPRPSRCVAITVEPHVGGKLRFDVDHDATGTIVLIIGHFLIPFLGLISRWPKRRPATLVFWGVWVLVFQYLDFFWQIQPAVYEQSQKVQSAPVSGLDPYKLLGSADKMVWMPLHPLPLLISLLCVVGVGGVFVAHTFYLLANKSLLPLRDPRLPEALAVESI